MKSYNDFDSVNGSIPWQNPEGDVKLMFNWEDYYLLLAEN